MNRALKRTVAEVHALGRRLKPGPLPEALVAKLREVERLVLVPVRYGNYGRRFK